MAGQEGSLESRSRKRPKGGRSGGRRRRLTRNDWPSWAEVRSTWSPRLRRGLVASEASVSYALGSGGPEREKGGRRRRRKRSSLSAVQQVKTRPRNTCTQHIASKVKKQTGRASHLDPLPRRRSPVERRRSRPKPKSSRPRLLLLARVLFALLLERLLDGKLTASLEQRGVLGLDEQPLLLGCWEKAK